MFYVLLFYFRPESVVATYYVNIVSIISSKVNDRNSLI
ncbi:hypothetical protein CHRY9293_03667 [Chryseobacterium potabilaquae]|uniref:Uncharacterized protein n=1 Tax=Chryseobacterium potabilaquae TaxID=2675057 RepID=A0A6N4XF74_9FLAO|nr:hypothetical protein CHRY9293_03667 [Chryseobacterium potabilaquae]